MIEHLLGGAVGLPQTISSPAASGIPGVRLTDLTTAAAGPDKINALPRDSHLGIVAQPGDDPALHATITGPKGTITP